MVKKFYAIENRWCWFLVKRYSAAKLHCTKKGVAELPVTAAAKKMPGKKEVGSLHLAWTANSVCSIADLGFFVNNVPKFTTF